MSGRAPRSELAADVIGDVHGHAAELVELLTALGYRRALGGDLVHPAGRQAVFVGDLIDRGPRIAETLDIVRGMEQIGSARVVLGNHELNALCFHTADPAAPGEALRRHTARSVEHHAATLRQLDERSLADALAWFRSLPFALDLGAFRVVHACWDDREQAVIRHGLEVHGGLTDSFLVATCQQESPLCEALENALKGREMKLPRGSSFVDPHGIRRFRARARWFADPRGATVRRYSFPEIASLPDRPVAPEVVATARPYPPEAPPVFFGHYWLDPRRAPLAPQSPNVACLDYSVARGGLLCAYRFDGPGPLTAERLVAVPARS